MPAGAAADQEGDGAVMIIISMAVDGSDGLVNVDNVCSVSRALPSDPVETKAVFVMSNGFRICVKQDLSVVAAVLGASRCR